MLPPLARVPRATPGLRFSSVGLGRGPLPVFLKVFLTEKLSSPPAYRCDQVALLGVPVALKFFKDAQAAVNCINVYDLVRTANVCQQVKKWRPKGVRACHNHQDLVVVPKIGGEVEREGGPNPFGIEPIVEGRINSKGTLSVNAPHVQEGTQRPCDVGLELCLRDGG